MAKDFARREGCSIEICEPPLTSHSMTYEVKETMPWPDQVTTPLSGATMGLIDKPLSVFAGVSSQYMNLTPVPKPDIINNPKHYGGVDNPYETIKVIEAWGLGFCLGNLLKYASRAGKKDPAKRLEDLKKARWYLDREISNAEAPQ